ncbi:MAG: hypothetical protein DRP08_02600 [Candidatus Aenigmatarchaeota archaeon]|nr:MAG: hypothetical protein DRP08_02600 [Candidatus Aenigmarchaeota archaeon]
MSAVDILPELAIEKSTYVIIVTFTDEDGDALTPNEVNWDLTNLSGGEINSRTGVSVTPASSVNIVLSGDDLAIYATGDSEMRELTVYGTYNSSYGNNLPYKAAVKFGIINLVAVT